MNVKKNGYVAGAVLMYPMAQKMRQHVEYEKFMCRILKDDERTRKFRENTDLHKDQLYALRYNNINAEKLTAAKRK